MNCAYVVYKSVTCMVIAYPLFRATGISLQHCRGHGLGSYTQGDNLKMTSTSIFDEERGENSLLVPYFTGADIVKGRYTEAAHSVGK